MCNLTIFDSIVYLQEKYVVQSDTWWWFLFFLRIIGGIMKRVFLVVLDSFGVGATADAPFYGDVGANTIKSVFDTGVLDIPNLRKMGLFNIDGVSKALRSAEEYYPLASFAKMAEYSKGKDTTSGHWEICGLPLTETFPTYPEGFPPSIIEKFQLSTGRKVLCNKPYSGTEVIKDYGIEHIKTGSLIVYTSADSVFQIAAHEDIVPVERLYEYCKKARGILTGKDMVLRVIARPFVGEYPNFSRTPKRKDFSVPPPSRTALDLIKENNLDVLAIGKINDIFVGKGITKSFKTRNNEEGMNVLLECLDKDFEGLCFLNLVDFDMLYGHRNDAKGYALALNFFDQKLGEVLKKLKNEDILIITADHGCDPGDISTDHTREYVPMIFFGNKIKRGVNLGTLKTFSDVSATILEYLNINNSLYGTSFFKEVSL